MKRAASSSFKQPPRKRQKKTEEQQIKTLQSKVRSIQRSIETKQLEFCENLAFATGVNAATGCWLYGYGFSDFPQGTTDSTRIGDQISVKRIKASMRVSLPREQLAPLAFRTLILCDKQHSNNSSAQAINNPFGAVNSVLESLGSATDPSVMLRKWDMKNRYRVYRDVVEVIEPEVVLDYDPVSGNTSLFVGNEYHKSFDIKIPNVKVQYTGPGGSNDEVSTNMFQILVIAQKVGQTTVPPAISCSLRMEFTDA